MIFPMKRLDFRLHDFMRVSWVSDVAREVWEPRIQRISACWRELEWRAVHQGLRACAWQTIDAAELPQHSETMRAQGLSLAPLQATGRSSSGYTTLEINAEPAEAANYRVVIGRDDVVAAFREAWGRHDDRAIGELLGYPVCCRAFFQAAWVEQGFIDTTWPMALNTRAIRQEESCACEVEGYAEANVLLRWIGVRAVPHLPCSFDCAATASQGQEYLALGRAVGYQEVMGWLSDILNWPVEWSALHGIAEIKTPLFKIAALTDATAETYRVSRPGQIYPVEGAHGLTFPFSQLVQPRLTESRGFRRGLDNPLPLLQSVPPQWYFSDNGFSSFVGMNRAHQPLLEMALEILGNEPAAVLDLGCGNGALLQKICQGNSQVVPFGVEIHAERVAHARLLLPDFAEHFYQGDMFNVEEVWQDQRFELALLMLGRLAEVDSEARDWLKTRLKSVRHLLVYVYAGYLEPSQSLATLAEELGIELQTDDYRATVAFVKPYKDTAGLVSAST